MQVLIELRRRTVVVSFYGDRAPPWPLLSLSFWGETVQLAWL